MSFISQLFLVLGLMSFSQWVLGATDSCACKEIRCGACEQQEGVKFYTEKCDGGNKLKSCVKPTCEPLSPMPLNCVSQNGSVSGEDRSIASISSKVVGKVKALSGSAQVLRNGTKSKLSLNDYVFEGDRIQTGKHGHVKVVFQDGNMIKILKKSEVSLSQFDFETDNQKTLLDLIKGGMRNQVFNHVTEKNYYKVRTKNAVVGVKGTDFFVNYEKGKRYTTKVETLKGRVTLESKDRVEKIEIAEGQRASYVVDSSSSLFNQDEINEFVAKGYMTPVYQMTTAEIKSLTMDDDSKLYAKNKTKKRSSNKRVGSANRLPSRLPEKEVKSLCMKPSGEFNHCSWACLNNPKGQKSCRTDMSGVKCVRKKCNANGNWAELTRLPASQGNYCHPSEVKVAPCDY